MSSPEWFGLGCLLLISAVVVHLAFGLIGTRGVNVVTSLYATHILGFVLPGIGFVIGGEPKADAFLWAGAVSALLMPLGAITADCIIPRGRTSLMGWPISTEPHAVRRVKLVLFTLAALTVPLVAKYVTGLEHSPFLYLLKANKDIGYLTELRAEAYTQGYIFGLVERFVIPLLCAMVVASWKYFSRADKIAGVAIIVMAFINNSYSSSKTTVALIFVFMLAAWWINSGQLEAEINPRDQARIRFRRGLVVALFLVLIIGYPLFVFLHKPVGESTAIIDIIIKYVFGRIFVEPAESSYYAFLVFPKTVPFTNFADVHKLAILVGWKPVDLGTTISWYRFGLVFASPPASIGTFYAQAGWSMVVFGVLIAAFILRGCENIFTRSKIWTPIHLALYVFIFYAGFRFTWGYFQTIFLTEAIVPAMALLFCWEVILRAGLPGGNFRRSASQNSRSS